MKEYSGEVWIGLIGMALLAVWGIGGILITTHDFNKQITQSKPILISEKVYKCQMVLE